VGQVAIDEAVETRLTADQWDSIRPKKFRFGIDAPASFKLNEPEWRNVFNEQFELLRPPALHECVLTFGSCRAVAERTEDVSLIPGCLKANAKCETRRSSCSVVVTFQIDEIPSKRQSVLLYIRLDLHVLTIILKYPTSKHLKHFFLLLTVSGGNLTTTTQPCQVQIRRQVTS